MTETSPTVGALAGALAKAQAEIEGASKDRVNPHFKASYATLASVWDACRTALAKNGLAVVQSPVSEGAAVTVYTTIMHASGEWMRSALTASARDGSPQSIGSAITYLRRYSLAAMVGVAPEDDDGNDAQPPRFDQAPRSTPAPAPARSAGPPADGRPGPGWSDVGRPDPHAGQGPRGQAHRADGRISGGDTKAGELDALPDFNAVNDRLHQVPGYGGDDNKQARKTWWAKALGFVNPGPQWSPFTPYTQADTATKRRVLLQLDELEQAANAPPSSKDVLTGREREDDIPF